MNINHRGSDASMGQRYPRGRKLAVFAAGVLCAAALFLAVPAGAAPRHGSGCGRPYRLDQPESLYQIWRGTGYDILTVPANVIRDTVMCSRGVLPRNFRWLLDGGYGQKIDQAQLPAGSRYWL